jgi:hypothetical protein
MTGRLEEARRTSEQGIGRCGKLPVLLGELGVALALLGRRGEALTVLEEMRELRHRRYVSPAWEVGVLRVLGTEEEVRDAFARMIAERSGLVPFLKADPSWADFRALGWFQEMLARSGAA